MRNGNGAKGDLTCTVFTLYSLAISTWTIALLAIVTSCVCRQPARISHALHFFELALETYE
ncbi:hypothetical protein AC244_07950 [Ensifer adhaerens]|uniref:Uncharacterized protein n=1 Tax=Ensifer adhaerens TaxID=106592 RepID=A0A0L8C3B8_ENSAD|nr:hypothetical protein [Ensifer adhaerens]KOF21279.1 hypothetical protein AC244_07950 [Ensifer adhaerens]